MLKRFFHKVTWDFLKKSLVGAASVVGVAATVMGIAGFSLVDMLGESASWESRLFWFLAAFLLITGLVAAITYARSRNGVSVCICGTDVEVKVGDLFAADGVRVIPFDEYFDTRVDDKVISRNSLNGIFIEQYAESTSLLRAVDDKQPSLMGEPETVDGRLRYRLGTVKAYDDYALLAFTHMDELNRAYLHRGQYEECLINMWAELNRMYAGRRVVLPLLGSGITRFDHGKPSEDDLLRCLLCTLRASGQSFKEGVLIVLTKETVAKMRLYEVQDYVGGWDKKNGEENGL